ncbi:hypothetical protein QLQ12_45815 [Actinoplanes sp. NEAU-A12]|uniref:Uncharacterized protein n=1 Tax=Actinoplanes sandaracinus TaxID=3045177 RepID=A0ABT6X1M2_9ACTN|nr:hypothetical protein [Actinoplanes sandaracinus]MDI6105912.1 hypothetical protein [Actinoplanes sandaracinus]
MALVAVAWVATNVWLIASAPLEGEPSPQALAAQVRAAVVARDVDAVRRLVVDAPEDDEVLAAMLRSASCGGASPTVAVVQRQQAMMLELAAGSGSCGMLPIAEHDGRWLVDLWAAAVR